MTSQDSTASTACMWEPVDDSNNHQTTCATPAVDMPTDMACSAPYWNDQSCTYECPPTGVCHWNQ
jgi:hypothetical protein